MALASQAAVCVEKAKLYEDIEAMFEVLVNSFTLALERRSLGPGRCGLPSGANP